jgi:glutamate N-acetyltransferase/amino-acid N-acetyltransferase
MANPSSRSVTAPLGFRAAGGAFGIKPSGKPDVALIVSDRPCVAAGVFTKNKLPGAPVEVAKRHLKATGGVRAVVCNSGCANDATGEQGVANAVRTCELVGEAVGCQARQVLPASTGVIGPQLPMDKLEAAVRALGPKIASGKKADEEAARAIMTTDLAPKSAMRKVDVDGVTVTIGGIAKGSGMIAPNMATMLVFITTDAVVRREALQAALRDAVAVSFNRISVDQHTSPSDMVLVLANGAAGASGGASGGSGRSGQTVPGPGGPGLGVFQRALAEVCEDLAYQIVQDGEGATKVFRVVVNGAKSQRDADRIGKAVVDSPLVKAAVHGGDPNWGRIVTAAGYSGAAIKPAAMSLYIGPVRDVCVFEHGSPTGVTGRTVNRLAALMQRKEVVFTLEIGLGKASTQWLGCDLSKEYVTINAEYTT